MKARAVLAAVLAACLLSPEVYAQAGKTGYRITKISPSIIKSPKYTYSGENRRVPKRGEWLEVEVEFDAQPEFTEELTVKYYVLFAGQLLVGEVTHEAIEKGRGLMSVMYVAPKALKRLVQGKPVTANAIENVGAELVIRGQLVGQKTLKPPRQPWWQRMQQVPGLLLNKNETPFFPLDWDRYEAIQSTGR